MFLNKENLRNLVKKLLKLLNEKKENKNGCRIMSEIRREEKKKRKR